MNGIKKNTYNLLAAAVISGMAVSGEQSVEKSNKIFAAPQSVIASTEQIKN